MPARPCAGAGIVVSFLPQHPLGDERNALETVRRTPRPGRAGSRPPPGRRPARRTGARRRPRPDDARAPPPGGARRALEAAGGPSIDGRARAMLLDLGIVEDDLTLPTSALSGGQRKLIALAAPSPRILTSCCSTSPKRTSTPSGARCSSGCSRPSTAPRSRSRNDRYLLDETVSQIAELHRGRIRMRGRTTRPTRSRAGSSCSASSSSS